MKIMYTIGLNVGKNRAVIPVKFSNHIHCDRVALLLSRLPKIDAWSIINNIYTEDELVYIGLRWIILHAYAMPWHTYFYPRYCYSSELGKFLDQV